MVFAMLEGIKRLKGSEVELEYLLTGQTNEETIMFVHGCGANLRQFVAQHEYFSKEYKVLSLSLRGHGKSSNPEVPGVSSYSLKKNRDDILELLEHLDIQNVNYVGNSAGGMIGYEIIGAYPNLLKSFITFGTTAELRTSRLATSIITGITQMMLKLGPAKYSRFIGKNSSIFPKVQKEIAELFFLANGDIHYFQRNLGNYSYIDVLEKMTVPFLLIKGENDKDINRNLQSTIHAVNKNQYASIVTLKQVGHLANLDSPEEFNRTIENFIKAANKAF